MNNLKLYYYDPEDGNLLSGWGESYELVPNATVTAPALRKPTKTHRYEYRFDEEAQAWQEIVHALPQPPEDEPEESALGHGSQHENDEGEEEEPLEQEAPSMPVEAPLSNEGAEEDA